MASQVAAHPHALDWSHPSRVSTAIQCKVCRATSSFRGLVNEMSKLREGTGKPSSNCTLARRMQPLSKSLVSSVKC